jgi:ABC-2 type transport system permease protein
VRARRGLPLEPESAVEIRLPSLPLAYLAFGVFLACVQLFAHANVAAAVFHQGSVVLAQIVFTPPPLAITTLMSFQVIKPTLALAVALGVGLLAIDGLAWRVVSAMFDRERLITGERHAVR